MIDAGATDDEIKTVIGGMKTYAGELIDAGKSDQEIEKLIGQTKWKNTPVFTSQVPQADMVKTPPTIKPVRAMIGGGGAEYIPTREDISRGREIGRVAMPIVGGSVGGAIAGPPGAVAGAMAGTGLSQAIGLEEPSISGVLASGAGQAIPAVGAKILTSPAVTSRLSKVAELIPGVSRMKLDKAAGTILDDVDSLIKSGNTRALWNGFKTSAGGLAVKDVPETRAAIMELKDQIMPLAKGIPGSSQLKSLIVGMEKKFTTGKPIDLLDLDSHVKAMGAAIGELERKGGVTLGGAKRFLKALYSDMENAPLTMTVGAGQAQASILLRQAAVKATKVAASKEDLMSTVASSVKTISGEGNLTTFRPDVVLNRIRALITPASKSYNANFAESLKDELPQIINLFTKLNKLAQGGGKAGSLVIQGLLGAGGGYVGEQIGGTTGRVIGTIAGVTAPTRIANIVASPAGRAVLERGLDAIIPSGNKAALNQVFQLAYQMARRSATAPDEQGAPSD